MCRACSGNQGRPPVRFHRRPHRAQRRLRQTAGHEDGRRRRRVGRVPRHTGRGVRAHRSADHGVPRRRRRAICACRRETETVLRLRSASLQQLGMQARRRAFQRLGIRGAPRQQANRQHRRLTGCPRSSSESRRAQRSSDSGLPVRTESQGTRAIHVPSTASMARSRIVRWLVRGVAGLLLLVVAVIAAALIYRARETRPAERQMIIATADGIDEALFVTIGGVEQWVTIRGQHRNNPVVLMLHGGPGAEQKGLAVSFLPWEKDFVVVQWDQPGAGRTFGAAGRTLDPGLTIERMARDGNELAAWLMRRFHRQNTILLGWSWGSALGTYMVKARPD